MMDEMGIETGIDVDRVLAFGKTRGRARTVIPFKLVGEGGPPRWYHRKRQMISSLSELPEFNRTGQKILACFDRRPAIKV